MTDLDVRRSALPLNGVKDLDPLLERAADAEFVLIGEASHGTHDFYAWRAELTRRLIAERGFGFVGVEGDWPDCERVHRAVTSDVDPFEAIYDFRRWPTFMWANEEVVEFCRWLRRWNAERPPAERCGFHGLDVYSLWDSLRAVRRYATANLPGEMEAVLEALYCFEAHGHDPQQYGPATRLVPESCEDEVVNLLSCVARTAPADEGGFGVRQNAEVVAGAERYYRALVRGGPESWNVRDVHMADTMARLAAFHGTKGVVWAHNSHVGDARATDMAAAGMTTLGQLARERHGRDTMLVGFASYRGSVVAAERWGGQHHVMRVPPARPASLESLLHEALPGRASLFLVPPPGLRPDWYDEPLGHRAIGVVYHPERDRTANYVPTVVGRRYDALIWVDESRALHPLHGEPWDDAEPATYPTAM
ncbi:erythromycin esterase family protein [Nonomuraea jiangxiensis]|uniref:Erythromycin esterase homolog n=1 Tax=Nonomuraea jiangxiensis TaxID=633440 RepID=A0A1G8W3B7_9ACTN|nr:erythromycin esterase family protein [Nonomuraea jiangxiensis]SDJ72215.1 Erythromycin esterase homolog [Nonomuraea jiangxiensis]